MLNINESRYQEMFEHVSKYGHTQGGGVNRPALSQAHLDARKWFRARAHSEGLRVEIDGAGNNSIILDAPGSHKTLLIGSHLDSAPDGGRYDGALGVIAGFEVLLTLRDEGVSLDRNVELIDFTDEESQLIECLGSRALIGDLSQEEFRDPRCGSRYMNEALERGGISEESILQARRDPGKINGYLELHIEQGPTLVNNGIQIGVVTGIVGIRTFRLRFVGQQAHAGTTPMSDRHDAGRGASSFLVLANDLVETSYPGCVITIGRMTFSPGATSIVPGRVDLFLEFRGLEESELERLEHDLMEIAESQAERFGLGLALQKLSVVRSVSMDDDIRGLFHDCAEELGISHMDIASGAGHDAQLLGQITHAGMIFIPSTGGSHNPNEHARWEDCINGANVLLSAAMKLAT